MIKSYRSFIDIADGLVGVGLITQSEDMPGMLQLDKGHNDMSKFLNRILGMKVEKQNLLFRYFADTLNAIINQAKRSGKYDQVYLLSITLFFVMLLDNKCIFDKIAMSFYDSLYFRVFWMLVYQMKIW